MWMAWCSPGTLDKKTLGGGSKENLFHVLMRDYSTVVAADRMSRVAKFCARWLAYDYLHHYLLLSYSRNIIYVFLFSDQGFSIGISDVQPSARLVKQKDDLVNRGYAECEKIISQYKRCDSCIYFSISFI